MDALAGRRTRQQRDLDLDIDGRDEAVVLGVLADLGYVVETDWRPTRVELVATGGSRVDVHPLEVFADGSPRQADLDGGYWRFPVSCYATGWIGGHTAPCVSVEAQLRFHEGYELRTVDRTDLAVLAELAVDSRDGVTHHVAMDPAREIDQLIATHDDWRGKALARARETILAVDPGIVEGWKYMGSPCWDLDGPLIVGDIFKAKVKLGFQYGASLPDPAGLFNGELGGKQRRAYELYEGDALDEAGLSGLVRAAIERNREKKKR